MNPNKQKMAIAEACPAIFEINNGRYKLPFFIRYRASGHECDPLNDLNAMHETEETLTEHEWNQMFEWLIHIRWRDANATERHGIGKQKALSPSRADAAQRAEAFLRTIGKWEE